MSEIENELQDNRNENSDHLTPELKKVVGTLTGDAHFNRGYNFKLRGPLSISVIGSESEVEREVVLSGSIGTGVEFDGDFKIKTSDGIMSTTFSGTLKREGGSCIYSVESATGIFEGVWSGGLEYTLKNQGSYAVLTLRLF